MEEWKWPSRQDLIKNGLPTYDEMFWGSPLKWVLLIYLLLAIGFYSLYTYSENEKKAKMDMKQDSLKIINIQK